MNIENFIEGATILRKYFDKHGYQMGAEHDVVYIYATDRPVEPADLQRLIDLGWFQEEADYDPDDGFKVENYDPEESWTAYV